jgi:hypothetical protein
VRVLGVDLVTEVSSNVIGSISGERMGGRSWQLGRYDRKACYGLRKRDTPGDLIVDRWVFTGELSELIVERARIERELSGYFNYWWPCDKFDSDNRLRNGNRYLLSGGWKGNSMYSFTGSRRRRSVGTTSSTGPVMTHSTGSAIQTFKLWNDTTYALWTLKHVIEVPHLCTTRVYDATVEGCSFGYLKYLIGLIIREINYQIVI